MDREPRLARRRGEGSLARAVRKVEPSGPADAGVVVLGAGDDPRDQVADAVVVLHQPPPAHPGASAQGRLGEARNDLRFAEEVFAGRLHPAARHLDDAHRVLGGDESAAVVLGATEAGKDQRRRSRDEVRAVQRVWPEVG